MVLELDGAPEEALLDKLRGLPEIQSATFLKRRPC